MPWPGSSVGWSIVSLSQGCGLILGQGMYKEATNECVNKWNDESLSPKSINKNSKKENNNSCHSLSTQLRLVKSFSHVT